MTPTQNPQPSTFGPDDQAKFDAILKANNYTPPTSTGTTDWYSYVKGNSKPAPAPNPNPTGATGGSGPSLVSRLEAERVARTKDVANDIQDSAASIASNPTNSLNFGHQIELGTESVLRNAMKGANNILLQTVSTLPDPIKNAISKVFTSPFVSKSQIEDSNQLITQLQGVAEKHPEAAKHIDTLIQFMGLLGAPKALTEAGAAGGELLQAGKGAAGKAAETASGVVDTAKGVLQGGKEVISGGKAKVNTFLGGKTEEQVLATPESDLHKLSASERQKYFEKQYEALDQKSSAVETKVQAELQTKTAKLQSEAEQLNKDLAASSRDKVIELRPKIRTALGKQSQEYRRLVSEELAPHAAEPVKASELNSFIDSRFADNPDMASAVKSRLGVPAAGAAPSLEPDTTIGKIYQKVLDVKSEMGAGVKKGARVFTADEKMTDDAISTLNQFLKSKGVDLKTANEFWAKYAPVRDQLVREAKPFIQSGTQTKTFASTLTRVAQGTDVNNENFIKEVEKLLGEPVDKDAKDILSKLDANKKQAIAAEVEAEAAKADARLAKAKGTEAIGNKKFQVNQRADRRTFIKRVIYGALGAEAIKKYGF